METRYSLTGEQISALQAIDTPTICNAIERLKVRGRMEGFLGMDVRCLTPELGTMVGYAVTLKVDSTTPDVGRDDGVWMEWVQAMAASPKPAVLVFQDVGPQPRKSAHFGEVMGTLARRMGVVGLITDGGVRDLVEVRRLGLNLFAAGLAPSHGNPRLLEINIPVTVDGVTIYPGDLLHGDVNGVTTIPIEAAASLYEAVKQVRDEEAALMDYINGPDFSVEGFRRKKFGH
jgi:4-hydroxy-4-methyl-2-oxoglutarate aldolase